MPSNVDALAGRAIYFEAIRLAQLGLAVHWLHPRSKIPVHKDWQLVTAAARDLDALRQAYRAGYNGGICTGVVGGAVDLVVLDIDDEQAHGYATSRVAPTPLRVATRQGEQWYYRHPGQRVSVPTRAKIDRYRLDLRADLGQVVCPPSIHPTGAVYSWITEPSPDVLRALPVWKPEWFPTAPSAHFVPWCPPPLHEVKLTVVHWRVGGLGRVAGR